ncbi:MAG: hypothetical protein GX409_11080 [candidate division Zixibacteria bacterium]|jgi:hypothetical protein|nr:hypothetical protein [candidate division Zixibacteria bacterium]
MITLLKYSISLIIWAVVAGAFLIAKSPQLFAFWALLGTAILVGWFFKMFWKWFVGIFFPTIELRAYIIGVLILLIGALLFFEYSIVPKWNRWGATKDELEEKYAVDDFLPQAKTICIRAITIDAPVKEVYPLVQKLTTEGILNFNVNLLDLIRNKPAKIAIGELPTINVGDRYLIGNIVQVKENKSLTMELFRGSFPWNKFKSIYAGYYLEKGNHNSTRVIYKIKADYDGAIAWFSAKYLIEVVDFLVCRYQLYALRAQLLSGETQPGK